MRDRRVRVDRDDLAIRPAVHARDHPRRDRQRDARKLVAARESERDDIVAGLHTREGREGHRNVRSTLDLQQGDVGAVEPCVRTDLELVVD